MNSIKMKIGKMLEKYTSANSKESAMRLMSLLIVISSCIVTLCIGFVIVYSVITGKSFGYDLAAIFAANSTFAGVGLWGKYKQKQVELDSNKNSNNENTLNHENNTTEIKKEADKENKQILLG